MAKSSVWITRKLTVEETAIVLAGLMTTDPKGALEPVHRALFIDLSKSFERRWPQQYQITVQSGVIPHWRQYLIDKMSPDEREAALRRAVR